MKITLFIITVKEIESIASEVGEDSPNQILKVCFAENVLSSMVRKKNKICFILALMKGISKMNVYSRD